MRVVLRRSTLALLAVLAALLALHGHALAHANLVRSLPPAGAVLDTAPAQVQLWFSEPAAPRFSELQVVDVQGARVDLGDTHFAPDDLASLSVGLRQGIPTGSYVVIWRVVSAVDGHATRGTVPFAVGVGPEGGLAPPRQGVEGYSASSAAAEGLARWVMLVGLLVASGAFAFAALVWRGALRVVLAARPVPSGLNGVSTWLARLVLIGTLLALVGSFSLLVVQAARAGGGFAPALGNVLIGTRLGYAWWARAALLALAGAMAWRWAGRHGERRLSQAGLVTMALALLTVSVVGHGAAAFRWVWAAVLGDWLHLMAVGAWAGALPSLLLSVVVVARRAEGVERARLLAMLVSGFSDVALAAVAVVALSGAFSAYLHVGSFAGVASGYGATLVVKTSLFLGVLAAAGVNLLVVRPRLRALAADRAPSTLPKTLGLLRRALAAEVALVACVVGASALLASMDTARRPEGPGNQGRVAVFQRQSGDLALSLQVAYIGGGQHSLALQAKDRTGPVIDVEHAVVRSTYLVRDVGESEVVLHRQGGEYSSQGLFLPLAGTWQLELLPLRPSPTAAPERFQVTVVASGLVYPALAEAAQAPPNRAVPLALAGVLLLVALAAVFRGGMLPRRKRRQAAAMVAGGLCAGVVGMAALLGQLNAIRNGESIPLVNPFPATPQSVAAGEALYRQHCLACHGPSGRGDGPAAAGLSPRPADLPVHVPLHGDRQLFVWVSNGLPGTAMPAFRDELTTQERWNLLNYLKSFQAALSASPAQPAPSTPPAPASTPALAPPAPPAAPAPAQAGEFVLQQATPTGPPSPREAPDTAVAPSPPPVAPPAETTPQPTPTPPAPPPVPETVPPSAAPQPSIPVDKAAYAKIPEIVDPTNFGWPRTIKTAAGPVTIQQQPQRILPLSPGFDEITLALVPLARIAAVPASAADPLQSNVAELVQGVPNVHMDVSEVLNVKPDLVVADASASAGLMTRLNQAGTTSAQLSLLIGVNSVERNIRLLAYAYGTEGPAEGLIFQVRVRLERVKRVVDSKPLNARPRVLFYLGDTLTYGSDTTADSILQAAGGMNAAPGPGIQNIQGVGMAIIPKTKPDVIVVGSSELEKQLSAITKNGEMHLAPAVHAGAIYGVPPPYLSTSSQWSVRGVEELAKLLWPKDFAGVEFGPFPTP